MCFSTLSDQKVYEPFLLAKITITDAVSLDVLRNWLWPQNFRFVTNCTWNKNLTLIPAKVSLFLNYVQRYKYFNSYRSIWCALYKIVGLICIHITQALDFSVSIFLATWQLLPCVLRMVCCMPRSCVQTVWSVLSTSGTDWYLPT
jgi:hypothetical protein